MVMEDRAMTDVEVAEFLGVHRLTVVRRIQSGDLRSFKIGRSRKVMFSDVLAFVEGQKRAEQERRERRAKAVGV